MTQMILGIETTPTDTQVKTTIATAFGENIRDILENHLIEGQYTVAAGAGEVEQFTEGSIQAYSGKTLTVMTDVSAEACQCPTGVVFVASKTGGGVSQVPIVKADISTAAGINNGILQVVGGVIVP
jgi:hypothetical protein